MKSEGQGRFEADEQAFQDDWALRILRCPRLACRRTESCAPGPDGCPALQRWPLPGGIAKSRRAVLRHAIEELWAAIQAARKKRRPTAPPCATTRRAT
jgi:hypothetical protein